MSRPTPASNQPPALPSTDPPPLLSKQRSIAPPGFNRRLVPPAALAIHLCIGQAYALTMYVMSAVLVAGFLCNLAVRRVREEDQMTTTVAVNDGAPLAWGVFATVEKALRLFR